MVAIKKSDTDGKLFKVREVGGLISNDYVESGFPYFLQDQASDQMTAGHNQLILDCLACVYVAHMQILFVCFSPEVV